MHHNLEISICDPLKYTMGNSKLSLEKSIRMKRVNITSEINNQIHSVNINNPLIDSLRPVSNFSDAVIFHRLTLY